jgi:uncharacterized protein YqeY
MELKQRIEEDLKKALKARESERVACLRMLKSKILEREVALRGEKGRDYRLEDAEALQVISAYAKQRRDSIESFRQGGREELAAREEAELAIVSSYLPRQLDREEIERIVDEAIAESGASSPREMGQVMKLVMPRLNGAADGKLVNSIVRDRLQPPEQPAG